MSESVTAGHYRLKHVVKSEVLKLVTLPSTAITLAVTVAIGLLVTGLVTHAATNHGAGFQYGGFDPTQEALSGLIFAALAGGVFGGLVITGEYSSGSIRTTLAATPKRPMLLAAKISVAATATVVFCELLSFAAFFLGQAVLSTGTAPTATLSSPGALRAVVLTGLYIALMTLMSFGFGLICRSTAATIACFAGAVFVLPIALRGISEHTSRYLPADMLVNSVMATAKQQGEIFRPLTPDVGLLLMAVYAAISIGVGALLFVNRDV